MNKKIFISVLTAVLVCPAFAQIANNATCNNTNLGQSDNNSTANVEANWNANTININWYNGDTKITSNTCTYDGQITLPAQPSKPGYTFAGWRLRGATTQKQCNEITDSTECENATGCTWLGNDLDRCVIELPQGKACEDLTETECNGGYGSDDGVGYLCDSWDPNIKRCYATQGSAGSN